MSTDPTSTPPADPRIGLLLEGRYRIVRPLGHGGMGSVYEGEHVRIKRRVAIKILHAALAERPDVLARFQREAEAASAIGHPHIIEVTDMGELPDGSPFMVLEHLDGRDWAADLAAQGAQPIGRVVEVLDQVCDALEAAHAQGIVHRDLKPENVFLIARGGDPDFVKVLDFGISKVRAAPGEDAGLTKTGTALGTPYYMAPEQCRGDKDIDHRADIYALGVMIYQALAAQHPFDAETYPMLVLKICTEAPPPLGRYRPDVPPELVAVVERMLAKLPEHRFSSCAEVRAALAPFRDVVDAPRLATDAPRTASSQPAILAMAKADGTASSRSTQVWAAPEESSPTVAPASGPGPSATARWILITVSLVLLGTGVAIASVVISEGPRRPQAAIESRAPNDERTRATGDDDERGAADGERTRATGDGDDERGGIAADRTVDESGGPVADGGRGDDGEREPVETAADAAAPSAAPGRVRVTVVPFGEVLVDGRARGQSPLTLSLPPGEHVIVGVHRGRRQRRVVRVEPGERERVSMRF